MRSAIVLALLFGLALHASAMKAPPCPGNRYLIDLAAARDLAPIGGVPVGLDVADDGSVALGDCGPADRANVKGRAKATKVRATWRECGTLRKVKVKATIAAPACDVADAKVRARKVKKVVTTASPSTCGDGALDLAGGERCDASAIGGDAACPAGCFPPGHAEACRCDPLVVMTEAGAVRGLRVDGARSYYGIPYAAPPVGDLRWASPEPPLPWDGVRDATVAGSICRQTVPVIHLSLGSEDCLFANVHVPDQAPTTPLPVMVWFHGGGLTVGDGISFGMTEGSVMAARGDVVVVTLNYRLGQFGFLAHPALSAENPARPGSGDFGFEDQVAVLRWVRDNIEAFGGDPDNVTIFGESAGGQSVCAMLATPLATGLFHRAIVQSGPCWAPAAPLAGAESRGERFASELGCGEAADVLACMRAKSTEEVFATLSPPDLLGLFDTPEFHYWGPVIDGTVFPEQWPDAFAAGRFSQVPVMAGSTRDEGTIFAIFSLDERGRPLTEEQYPDLLAFFLSDPALTTPIIDHYPVAAYPSPTYAFAEAFGDGLLACPTIETAKAVSAHAPTWLYQFEYPDAGFALPTTSSLGAFHSAEIQFVFQRPVGGTFTAAEQAIADAMLGYWTRFAATGDPNGGGAPAWPPLAAADQHLVLDTAIALGTGAQADDCAFWRSIDFQVVPLGD